MYDADQESTTTICGPRDERLVQLLSAATAGDDQAWGELVARFGGMLGRLGRQRGLNAHDAADVAQMTWLMLFTHADRIRHPERLAGWLATTVSRQSLAAHRRTRREVLTDGSDLERLDDGALEEGLLDRLDAVRRRQALHRAVCCLPPRERALVEVLLEPEPVPYHEISRRLGMPIGAIGPVRQRALRRLRRILEEAQPQLAAGVPASA